MLIIYMEMVIVMIILFRKHGWGDQVGGDLEIGLLLENLEKEHHKENLEKEHLLKGQEHHRDGRGHLEDLEESKQNLI